MGFAIFLFHHEYIVFLALANFSSVLQSHRILGIVSTSLHCRPFFTSVDDCIRRPQDSWCFIVHFPAFVLCIVESFAVSVREVDGDVVGVVTHLVGGVEETVLLLGLLFLQTDSSFEVGIMDDFVQC